MDRPRGKEHESCKAGDVCNNKSVSWLPDSPAPPRLHPISMCMYVFRASTWEGVQRDWSSSLSVSPGTSLRRCSTGRLRDSTQHHPLPLALVNTRGAVKRTEIWIIGARPSVPRLTQASNCQTACAWACGLASLATSPDISSTLMPLSVGVHCNLARPRQVKLCELLGLLES